MEEGLQKTANEALSGIIEGVASAKEFILAELPEVVQQLLMWKMAESLVVFVVCLSVILAVFVNAVFILKYLTKRDLKEEIAIPWGITSIVISLFGIVIPLCEINLVWLQIWVAPKVYLLEYAASLVK